MTEPKRSKKLPKDVAKLTDEELMQKAFGKKGAKELKKAAHEQDIEEPEKP